MSSVGFFSSWKSERFGFRLTFTRIFLACVFLSLLAFDAVIYVRDDLRFSLFGFEESWLYVCIVAEVIILTLLGVLASNSYALYSLDDEGIQREAELNWLHQQELEKARSLIREYQKELNSGTLDMNTNPILEGMYKLVCQIYPYITDTNCRMKTVENTIGYLSEKIPAGSLRHLTQMKETMDSMHRVSCTVLANVAQLEDKVNKIRSGPVLGNVVNTGSSVSISNEIQTLRNLIGRIERAEEGIKNSLTGFREMEKGNVKDYKQFTAKISSFETAIADLTSLLCGVREIGDEFKASIYEAKDSRLAESIDIKLFKGQIDQLLERTEILDSFRSMLHKYSALMESSRGDIEEFLKMDQLVSQPVTALNLGRDIRSALLRNGLDKVESLLVHDAPTIQQMTRLGPKRMQRLEAALKDYSPQLGFGMYAQNHHLLDRRS